MQSFPRSQPSRAATKCHSSTAENSPKRSWISRSETSRKIQLVVRRRSPFTKCTRPRTAPTSASGCISTNTSHRSSPRYNSPMCLARSCPGKGALMGTTLCCLSDSCQLDSGLNELSRVRSAARRHCEVLSQVRCPSGGPSHRRMAGRPSLGSGRGGVGSTTHRGCVPARWLLGRRESGGARRNRSRLPPPDISQMSPEERATRLYNRVMMLHTQGKADSAAFFLPMALQAYTMLPALDVDARYHIGVLDLTGGNAAAALAQADTIRRTVPTHLFGYMLRARGLELERDTAGARRAYRDFLRHEAAERTRRRPEYGDHAENLDAFHEQAAKAAGAARAAPRGN